MVLSKADSPSGRKTLMGVIKIRLAKELDDMRDPMEHMVEEMLHLRRTFVPRSGACWAPPTDLYETREEIIVMAEMAGLKNDEIQVVIDGGLLRISGRRANPIQDIERQVHQMEIDFGPFERKIRIRVPVESDRIQAVYRDGFLIIRVPKSPELSREIRVK